MGTNSLNYLLSRRAPQCWGSGFPMLPLSLLWDLLLSRLLWPDKNTAAALWLSKASLIPLNLGVSFTVPGIDQFFLLTRVLGGGKAELRGRGQTGDSHIADVWFMPFFLSFLNPKLG